MSLIRKENKLYHRNTTNWKTPGEVLTVYGETELSVSFIWRVNQFLVHQSWTKELSGVHTLAWGHTWHYPIRVIRQTDVQLYSPVLENKMAGLVFPSPELSISWLKIDIVEPIDLQSSCCCHTKTNHLTRLLP